MEDWTQRKKQEKKQKGRTDRGQEKDPLNDKPDRFTEGRTGAQGCVGSANRACAGAQRCQDAAVRASDPRGRK